MLKGLNVIRCSVADMEASVKFYRDLLGLPLKSESPGWSEFDLGSNILALHRARLDTPQPVGGWVVSFQVDDIKAARSRLEAAAVAIPGDFHDIPGGVTLGIEDPDGNPLDLIQYTG